MSLSLRTLCAGFSRLSLLSLPLSNPVGTLSGFRPSVPLLPFSTSVGSIFQSSAIKGSALKSQFMHTAQLSPIFSPKNRKVVPLQPQERQELKTRVKKLEELILKIKEQTDTDGKEVNALGSMILNINTTLKIASDAQDGAPARVAPIFTISAESSGPHGLDKMEREIRALEVIQSQFAYNFNITRDRVEKVHEVLKMPSTEIEKRKSIECCRPILDLIEWIKLELNKEENCNNIIICKIQIMAKLVTNCYVSALSQKRSSEQQVRQAKHALICAHTIKA